ncbi:MAG: hypothetical protein HXX20_24055 [Chloroflexi bacterium]|nr:hypothetical protein [Chloroflexota bacterium]
MWLAKDVATPQAAYFAAAARLLHANIAVTVATPQAAAQSADHYKRL